MTADKPPFVEGSPSSSHWVTDFVKPINVAFLMIAVISLALTVYFYRQTQSSPEISWALQKQIVFDHRNANSAITVLDRQGNSITENMYADQFVVWNSGNVRLDNVDASTIIRKPLTLTLRGAGHIVSASITGSKNDMNGGWDMTTSRNDASLLWKHFDQNAIARILVLYTGDNDTSVEPSIFIAGYSALKAVTYQEAPQGVFHRQILPLAMILIFGVMSVGAVNAFAHDFRLRSAWRKGLPFREFIGWRASLIIFIAVVALLLFLLENYVAIYVPDL